MAMGWLRLCTHRGVTMTGSRSVRYRSISNEAEPEPRTTAARSTTVGTPELSRMRATSARERRCGESSSPAGSSPPRWTSRPTPAARAAAAMTSAVRRSVASKEGPLPSAWIR